MLTRRDQDDLWSLRFNWEGAYDIWVVPGEAGTQWHARSLWNDDPAFTAVSAKALRLVIREHYQARKLPVSSPIIPFM